MRLGDLYGFIGFHAYAGSAEEGAASESFVFSIPETSWNPPTESCTCGHTIRIRTEEIL